MKAGAGGEQKQQPHRIQHRLRLRLEAEPAVCPARNAEPPRTASLARSPSLTGAVCSVAVALGGGPLPRNPAASLASVLTSVCMCACVRVHVLVSLCALRRVLVCVCVCVPFEPSGNGAELCIAAPGIKSRSRHSTDRHKTHRTGLRDWACGTVEFACKPSITECCKGPTGF